MKRSIRMAKLIQWPAVYVVLAVMLQDRWSAVAFTLVLVFRNELSVVLRHRRLIVQLLGFRCCLDGDTDSPGGTARNPPWPEQ